MLLFGVPCHVSAAPPTGTLHWQNSDELAGELLGATRTHLRWRSPLFSAPLSIDMRYLATVQLRPPEKIERPRSIQFVTSTGDTLYGQLLSIADGRMVLEAPLHGQLTLPLSAIRSFRRLDNPALIYTGPNSLQDWRTLHSSTRITEWKTDAAGTLTTRIVGAELFRDLQLPGLAEIDIRLQWERKPGFMLTFAAPNAVALSKYTVKLETWEDEVVLQTLTTDGDFEQLLTLDKHTKSLHLRIVWDQETGALSVYAENGQLLGKRSAGEKTGIGKSGIYLQNKGTDLTLAHIRVNHWSGVPSTSTEPEQGSILLNDGSSIQGQIQGYDAQSRLFTIREASGTQRQVPMDQVASGLIGTAAPQDATPPAGTRVSYYDGTRLYGSVQSIDEQTLTIQTSYSEKPIACGLAGMRELVFPSRDRPDDELEGDRLVLGVTELHGVLAAAGPQASQVGWRLVGSDRACPLDLEQSAIVTRPQDQRDAAPAAAKLGDVLHLRNGDLIPCHVRAISDTDVLVHSVFADETRVPRGTVRTIQFGADDDGVTRGFGGDDWTFIDAKEETIEFTDQQVVFNGRETLANSAALLGEQIQFDVDWGERIPASLTIGLGKHAATSSLMLYFANQQIYIRGLQGAGAQHLQAVMQQHKFREHHATVRLALSQRNLKVYLDDRQVMDEQLGDAIQLRQGIRFDVQAFAQQAGNLSMDKMLTISKFQMGGSQAPIASLMGGGLDLETLLTVPRMRSQSPPTHMLMARNGDLLRGRLERLVDNRVVFTSRMDEISIPRDRLMGIIWLQAPDQQAPSPSEVAGNVQAVFNSGITFLFTATGMEGENLIGEHSVFGPCEVPVAALSELRIGEERRQQQPAAFVDWKLRAAKEPRFAEGSPAGGGSDVPPGQRFGLDSALVGTAAEHFSADMVDGTRFQLSDYKGQVMILDFWATWCGPCVKSLPEVIKAVQELPSDKVRLVTVNQMETADAVRKFLKTRELDATVALDPEGDIARKYQVDAIPQTVVIGPTGQIERVYIGAHPRLAEELQHAVRTLLTPSDESGE